MGGGGANTFIVLHIVFIRYDRKFKKYTYTLLTYTTTNHIIWPS